MRLIVAGLGVLIALVPLKAHPGATSPKLVISTASGVASGGGRAAAFQGDFDSENAIQLGYDLEIVVFQSDRFARFPVAALPQVGVTPALVDGQLTEDDIGDIDAASSSAPAGVRIVTFNRTRIVVVLPASFETGPATAVVLARLAEGPVLSNSVTFTLP